MMRNFGTTKKLTSRLMLVLQKMSIRFFKRFPTAIHSGKMYIHHLFCYDLLHEIFSEIFQVQKIFHKNIILITKYFARYEKLVLYFNIKLTKSLRPYIDNYFQYINFLKYAATAQEKTAHKEVRIHYTFP